MKRYKYLHAALLVAGILLCLFGLSTNLVQGHADLASSISQEYDLDLEIVGPDVATLNDLVSYTINFTVTSSPYGDIWGIEYGTPEGFTVVSTSPVTSTQLGTGLLRWEADDLTDYISITVTGRHGLNTSGHAVHYVAFYDIYNPDLLSAEKETLVTGVSNMRLPLVSKHYPWLSPFGFESNASLVGGQILTQAKDLQAEWVRLNHRISWRELQPEADDPIQWDLLTGFEAELRSLKAAGLTPIVIVDDYPRWATRNDVRNDGQPTSCGPIKADRFDDYAYFMRELVSRYKTPEFNVHNWELGNEPDVDPNLIPPDYIFGCWGDIDDPYYGGEYYGEMVKIVGQSIKEEDPQAKVWLGGLLLDTPNTTDAWKGKPERFFEGILRAGADPYFDIVPYHAYPTYEDRKTDYDLNAGPWTEWGGNALGKAKYLREVMDVYGVEKPLFLNETGLMCPEYYYFCNPPNDAFYEMQATHIVRMFVRGLSGGVKGFIWYTLNGPGWRYTGLLDGNVEPKPVYLAYQQLNIQLRNTQYIQPVQYGEQFEAYAFSRGSEHVHVIWTVEDEPYGVGVPQHDLIGAYDLEGTPLTLRSVDDSYYLDVGFAPIYIIRKP